MLLSEVTVRIMGVLLSEAPYHRWRPAMAHSASDLRGIDAGPERLAAGSSTGLPLAGGLAGLGESICGSARLSLGVIGASMADAVASQETLNPHDVIIIGAGPAGASAAIYTARAELSTLVIDKGLAVGALGITGQISNYPGV